MKSRLFVLAALAGGIAFPLHAQDGDLAKRFGNTCFALDADKRNRADLLMQQFADKSRDPNATVKRMEALNAAAAIGHPEAFLAKCRIGKDKKAPPAMVTDGRIWCVVGMDVIPSLEAELDPGYVAELRSTEALSNLLNDISKVKGRMCRLGADADYPSEEDMRREYDRYKAAMGDKEYNVAHILVVEKATALLILERLANGERFADLARAFSIDTGSAQRGGDLDWSPPSNFVTEFAAAVVNTPAGTYSKEPVRTAFGWHIVKVEAARRLNVPSFEEIKESIRTQMRIKRAQQGR